jgi:hypothetical protein
LQRLRGTQGAVRPDPLPPRAARLGQQEQVLGPIPILDVEDQHPQQQSRGIHQNVPLAALYELRTVVAAVAPFSVVLALWLSTRAALGSSSRASPTRTRRRSASLTRCQVPSSRHVAE